MAKKASADRLYFIRWRKDGKNLYCRGLSRKALHALIKNLLRKGVDLADIEFWVDPKEEK